MENEIQKILDRNFTRGNNSKAKKELLDLFGVSGCLSQESLIDMLDDKRIVGTVLTENGWYFCRKQAAEYLLDMCNIYIK